jgi:hypothetical protein
MGIWVIVSEGWYYLCWSPGERTCRYELSVS